MGDTADQVMGLELFNKRSRPRLFEELSAKHFDLLVIGGGITGASILRDAALRGMSVALLEANDFASGTSGRSSKIIHGGLRYLRSLRFHLTWESCHERDLHVRLNGRLVKPWPFLIPTYSATGESRVLLRSGMWLYEIMAGFRNHRLHRSLGRDETLAMAPGLAAQGLTGGVLYYDAIVDDNRWTLETLKDGIRHGGLAVNHAPVTALSKADGRVCGVLWQDRSSGRTFETKARVVVNATGVWADRVRRLDRQGAPGLVKLSKGTHLIFAADEVPLAVSTVFFSQSDKRPLFMIKRDGCFLYGTTDEWDDAGPDAPEPGEAEISYLMRSLAQYMPRLSLPPASIKSVYSGHRALPASDAPGRGPSSVTREDLIEVSTSGLITVVGGKLTTARLMACRVLGHVAVAMGGHETPVASRTSEVPIGGSAEEIAGGHSRWARQCPELSGYFRWLFNRYGLDADGICARAVEYYRSGGPDWRTEAAKAEVEYVCRSEMPCTLEDLMERRAGLLKWDNVTRASRLRGMKSVICSELDMDDRDFEQGYQAYLDYLGRFHTVPALDNTAPTT